MDGIMQWVADTWQHVAGDPSQQVHGLLGLIATGVAYLAFRRRQRSRVSIDCPPGEKVRVEIGHDDDEDA